MDLSARRPRCTRWVLTSVPILLVCVMTTMMRFEYAVMTKRVGMPQTTDS